MLLLLFDPGLDKAQDLLRCIEMDAYAEGKGGLVRLVPRGIARKYRNSQVCKIMVEDIEQADSPGLP